MADEPKVTKGKYRYTPRIPHVSERYKASNMVREQKHSMGVVKREACGVCGKTNPHAHLPLPKETSLDFKDHLLSLEYRIMASLGLPERYMLGIDWAAGTPEAKAAKGEDVDQDKITVRGNSVADRIKELTDFYTDKRPPVYERSSASPFRTGREATTSDVQFEPDCPRCFKKMKRRTAMRGTMAGLPFFGCCDFPKCDGTRTINESKMDFPASYVVSAVKHTTSNHAYLELTVKDDRGGLVYGRRFRAITGEHIFLEFIEPASRAVGRSMKEVLQNLLMSLGVDTPYQSGEKLVRIVTCFVHDSFEEYREVVNTDGLHDILLKTKLVQEVLGIYKPSLFRVVLERTANTIQLRAKDNRGQTILTGELPSRYKEDKYALEDLVTSFIGSLREKTGAPLRTLFDTLLRNLDAAKAGSLARTAEDLYAMAVKINNDCTTIKEYREEVNHRKAAKNVAYNPASSTGERVEDWKEFRDLMNSAYSPATKKLIGELEKGKIGKAIDKLAAQYEQDIVSAKQEEAARLFKPKSCNKCGSNEGCMCPREEAHEKPPCPHRVIVQISTQVEKEIRGHVSYDKAVYACKDCHKIVTYIPLTDPTFK